MKINIKQAILIGVVWLVSFYFLLAIFTSCSSSFHLKKFYKKGGKIEQVEKTITLYDTIFQDGDTIIVPKEFTIDCPEPIAPKTRYQTRIEYKRFRDTLRLIEYKTKIEYKEAIREIKNDKKRGFSYNFRLALVIIGLILLIVLLFKFKK